MINPEWLEKCKNYLRYVATDIDGNRIAFVNEEDLRKLIHYVEKYVQHEANSRKE